VGGCGGEVAAGEWGKKAVGNTKKRDERRGRAGTSGKSWREGWRKWYVSKFWGVEGVVGVQGSKKDFT